MTLRQSKTIVYAVIPFLAAAGVVLDLIMPLGVADWVLYFVPLLLSVYVGRRSSPLILAAVFSGLTLLGFFFSPPGVDPRLAFVSRLIGVCVQWLVAYMLWRRKRMEEKNLQLAAIVESSDDAIIGKTLDGTVTSWNKGAERIYGYKEDEVISKSITLLIPAGHEDEMPLLMDRIRRGEQVEHYETVRKRKDGSSIDVSLTISPVKNIEGETVGASVVARDITLRKRADEALRRSEQKYRELVEHANSIIVRWKHDGEITFLNEFGQKFFGYSAKEILGRNVVGTIVPEAESTGRNLSPLMEQIRSDLKAFEQNVNENMRRNGERVWIAWTNKAVLDAHGQVREILSIGTDITGRKQAEKALSDSEERFRLLAESSLAGIYLIQDNVFAYVNPALASIFGYTVEEITGRLGPQDLTLPEDRPLVAGNIRRRVEAGVSNLRYEFRGQRKDGGVTSVEAHGGRIEYRGRPAILGTMLDITERKRAAQAIAQERQLLRTSIDLLPENFYVKDLDSRFLVANEALAKHLGKTSPFQILGLSDADFFSAEQAAGFRAEELKVFGGEPLIEQEATGTRADGRECTYLTTKVPFRDSQGRIQGLVGIGRDITERKRTEEALRESMALYHSLVEQLPAGVFRKDAEGRYVFVNSWFCRLKGVKAELFLGKKPAEVAAIELAEGPTNPSRINQLAAQGTDHHQQIMQTGQRIEVEEHGLDADGNEQHIFVVKTPIFGSDRKIVGTQGILFDVTERKRTEEALRESKALYYSLVEQMPTGVFRKDRAGRYVFVNSWFCELRGLTAEQIVGRTPDELAAVEAAASGRTHPEILQLLQNGSRHHEEILRTGKPIHVEEVYPTPEGGKRYLHVVKSAVFGPDARIVGTQGIQFDVTERKRVEQQLAETSEFSQKIISEASVGIIVYKASGQCELANEAAARTLNATVPELLKQNFRQIESWRAAGMLQMAEETLAGSPRSGEFHFTSTFDKEAWLVCHFSSFVRGNEPHLLLLFNDVLDRKRAEEALSDNEAFLNTVVENIPHMIFVKDAKELRFLKFNKAGQALLGYSLEELLGKNDYDFFPKELADRFTEIDRRVLRGKDVVDIPEEPLQTRNQGERIVHTKKIPIFDNAGQLVYLLGISEDITERKLAEEHIREQAALLDKAQDAIMVLNLDDRIVLWNKSAERIYGWSAAEAIGQKPLNLFLGGVVSPRHEEAWKVIWERGEWGGELQETTKDGKTVTVQGRCNVIFDEQGRPKARLIINTDVTERKKLEAQFLRAQRMESLGTLAGGIAHDLNNVLTPLLVAVQVLKEKTADDDGKRLLGSLEANVQRGAGLVKQVLAFGRGVEGERIIVQPKHIAREIKQMINETFPKSIAFELHSAPDLWTITGDPTQLHQILLNLCVNARDAMPNGGKLSLSLENVMLDEAYASMNLEARPGPYLCLAVNDTGTGIPKEIQEKIFDPFFTTKEPGKGTGLGLSTTLAIVKSHGGFIHCYSEPGKGSTFKVYLPANPTRPGTEHMTAEKAKLPHGHNNLVLVVDDEEPIRKLAQRALERYGYRVLLAADGTEAVSLYQPRQNEIDVVITDMAMPNMDGLATITALKSINPNVRIIGSSGMASDGGVAKAMAAGIQHFIPKPYTAETMLLALNDVLNSNGKH